MTSSNTIEIKYNGKVHRYREFDLNQLTLTARILVIGTPGSGKTVLCEQLVKYYREKIPVGVVYSQTEKENKVWSKRFPLLFIFHSIADMQIKKNKMRQTLAIAGFGASRLASRCLYLYEDCASDKKLFRMKSMINIGKNGRQFNSVYLFLVQLPNDLWTELRRCFDYVFIFNEPKAFYAEQVYREYSPFKNRTLFDLVFDTLTKDYRCMIIDCTKKNPQNQDELVYHFKADINIHKDKSWRFGWDGLWTYDKDRRDPDEVGDIYEDFK